MVFPFLEQINDIGKVSLFLQESEVFVEAEGDGSIILRNDGEGVIKLAAIVPSDLLGEESGRGIGAIEVASAIIGG